jgi:hypothetical protein
MALKLNSYKTITEVVPLTELVVYTAPVGYTGVVLLAQITNIDSQSHDVTLLHRRGSIDTEIAKTFPISGNDAINLVDGKLFLQTGDQLVLFGSTNTGLKFISSILETLN